jgi:hypothetical protein
MFFRFIYCHVFRSKRWAYIEPNGELIVNSEWKVMQKEAVSADWKVTSQHSPGGTKHAKLSARIVGLRAEFRTLYLLKAKQEWERLLHYVRRIEMDAEGCYCCIFYGTELT